MIQIIDFIDMDRVCITGLRIPGSDAQGSPLYYNDETKVGERG